MASFFLTEQDAGLLKGLLSDARRGRANAPLRDSTEKSWEETEDHQAPECYIALPPVTGIPALTLGMGGDIGGEIVGERDVPGSAFCTVYQLRPTGFLGKEELHRVPNLQKEVFNLAQQAIEQTWLVIVRDKFGRWIVDCPCAETTQTGTASTGTGSTGTATATSTASTGTASTGTASTGTADTGTASTGTADTGTAGTAGTASSSDQICETGGIDFGNLPVATAVDEVDFVLGIKDGCLVRIPVTTCVCP